MILVLFAEMKSMFGDGTKRNEVFIGNAFKNQLNCRVEVIELRK